MTEISYGLNWGQVSMTEIKYGLNGRTSLNDTDKLWTKRQDKSQ
jgi:hypothetical protein